jgi:amino acid transporter
MAGKRRTVQPGGDELLLRQLGYEPRLTRRMSGFGNFSISFSVISILSGCMTLYGFGLGAGGPAVMMWGWVGVGAMVLLVGSALAEVTSAYPTSGALYFMADRLGGRTWGWYTGWLNLLGLLGGIAGIDYGAASFIAALAHLQTGFTPTPGSLMGIYTGILLLHAVLNLAGVHLVSVLNSISVWWHLGGVLLIVAVLALVPSHHQSVSCVFGHYNNATGWHSPLYVALLGLLMAQYTFSGYDASAHLSEETVEAGTAAPRGIVRAIWVSWAAGFVLLFGLTAAIKDYAGTMGSSTGVPPAQIFLDAVGTRGAEGLLLVVIFAQLFCGNAEVAACSRMVFAFSRDGALPGSTWWRRTSSRTGTPVAAVWLSVVVAWLLALPALWSITAYNAVTAINIVGMTPAYAIPVYLRLRAKSRFTPGPWSLGRWSRPIGIAAVLWVAVVTVLVCLPQSSPITTDSFNYAPIALLAMLLLATVWRWIAGHSYTPPTAPSARMTELAGEVV